MNVWFFKLLKLERISSCRDFYKLKKMTRFLNEYKWNHTFNKTGHFFTYFVHILQAFRDQFSFPPPSTWRHLCTQSFDNNAKHYCTQWTLSSPPQRVHTTVHNVHAFLYPFYTQSTLVSRYTLHIFVHTRLSWRLFLLDGGNPPGVACKCWQGGAVHVLGGVGLLDAALVSLMDAAQHLTDLPDVAPHPLVLLPQFSHLLPLFPHHLPELLHLHAHALWGLVKHR